MLKRIVCAIFGHKWQDEGAFYYTLQNCKRCGAVTIKKDRLYQLDVQRLRLRSGDIIVLKTRGFLSGDAVKNLAESFNALTEKTGHENIRVAVLEEGTDIAVLGREE